MRSYLAENAFAFVKLRRQPQALIKIEAETPVSSVEATVDAALSEAAQHLQHEEYGLALAAYQALSALVLRELTPETPPTTFEVDVVRPPLAQVLTKLFATSVRLLGTRAPADGPAPTPTPTPPVIRTPPVTRTPIAIGPRVLRAHVLEALPVIDPPVVVARPLRFELPLGREIHVLDVSSNGAAALKTFYEKRVRVANAATVASQPPRSNLGAYLPHIYSFVIPMAIGDCHAGLGAYEAAKSSYASALEYPYLDEIELVRVWTRLAELIVEIGDHAYRAAGNDAARITAVAAVYEQIVTRTGSLDAASVLYADARFAAIKTRVQALLGNADPLGADENPAISAVVLRARQRLSQITAGLNFFGFAPDYMPPFTFEHLQTTARYFAQQASRLGAMYINFKSQAEREELGRAQLDQQVEVARATVDLERLNLTEARAGLKVAQQGLAYANLQKQHAVQARDAFNDVRWELLELTYLEAWSSAATVDEDDEITQTISGFTYYSSDHKRRSLVLSDLAKKKTRISHDLEAKRLQREIESATAYAQIAQAQVAQAQARVNITEMRVQIAGLQQRHAEENRDFVDGKELNAGAWYEMARSVRGLARRYLDMATEAAFLMERAYALETGRDLGRIRFDLASSTASGELAGEFLLADIDSFTQDYLTSVRTKRAPSKLVVSLSDTFPIAFETLKRSGRCSFETALAQLERGFPGAWLAKLRNVEVVFVGITSAAGLQGTLRNIGLSRIRFADKTETTILAPADVLPLSQYEPRRDSLLFRFNANELRVFENCGFATRWQLDLPLDANDFDLSQILDVQLVLYFDSFYDTTLEDTVRAALPPGGSSARGFSLGLYWPDELFYLRNQGTAQLGFVAGEIPFNQVAPIRRSVTLRASGAPDVIRGLVVRVASQDLGSEIKATLDASGTLTNGALAPLLGRSLFDRWTVRIAADDNPGRVAPAAPVLERLTDLQVFVEYDFTYRTAG
jgi:hypothetical protein